MLLAQLERLLALYALPSDPTYPVVWFDARPCLRIGDTLVPVPLQHGQVRNQQSTYDKLGSCALVAAIEPLTGRRLGQVHAQRTTRADPLFCQALAAQYPDASTIRLVQDHRTTHTASSCYAHLPADEAYALAQRCAFSSTPKSASWLNRIACACAVLTRLCLNRRSSTLEQLRTEVLALRDERCRKQITITWQFSIQAARTKLNTHYTRVHPANQKYKET